ncbi:putative bifunctional diguanylate cyclase/phosphodiesterase [Deinococcus aquaedulcis]|uniref:putative bifunctional diguanylate cyclase/phosphodiesterase n=1 Tax=Deinococcus aquaedulcis TaxID=2840455 RepID=UPI001C82E381|nr:EAL domain-containing protein [Deinococcus aquaedulcis]
MSRPALPPLAPPPSPQSLRLQVLALLLALFVPLGISALVVIPGVMNDRFAQIERAQLRQAAEIAEANLRAEQDRVGLFVLNFSLWTETFEYAAGRNPGYLAANLVPGTFKGGRVDYWGIQAPDGRVLSAATLRGEQVTPAPQVLRALFAQLPQRLPPGGSSGVVALGGRPVVVAARVITRDDGQGQGGVMLLARELTPEVLSSLMYNQRAFGARLSPTPPPATTYVFGPDEGRARLALQPPSGPPQLVLEVSQPRAVSQAGAATTQQLRLAVILAGLLTATGLLLFLNRRVLNVVEGYKRDVQQIAHNPAHRLDGRDRTELGLLAGTINELLDHLQAREAQLRQRAQHDELTGAYTLAGLLERLDGDQTVRGALVVELPRLQEWTGLYGEHFVDTLIAALAARLRAAGPEHLSARLSTTTMALVTRAPQGLDPSALLSQLEQPFRLTEGEVMVKLTAGYAEAPGGLAAQTLLRHAGIALQHALDHHEPLGLFTETLLQRSQEAHLLETQLPGAAARGELFLAYQPVMEVTTGAWVSVEALLRWTHPVYGPVSPATFVPIAERSGQIYALGDWALRAAVREVLQARAVWPQARVNVNVSPVQLLMPDFAARVLSVLETLQAPAELLTLEVTESTVMQNVSLACTHLHHLREAGVRIALDDFGSGHSSLGVLTELPLDVVKLDRSFLRASLDGTQRAALLHGSIRLAADLGLSVVAEGVEDEDMLQRLRDLQCTYAQGYYIARPQPLATLLPQRPSAASPVTEL